MSADDAGRWNARYQQGWHSGAPQPREVLLRAAKLFHPDGLVLDLAMGMGANACWLLQNGFRVVGVDVSSVAVQFAKRQSQDLMAFIGDLGEYHFPPAVFSAVLNFYFLDRSVLSDLSRILIPNGFAVVETLTVDMLEIKPELPGEFLLQAGELRDLFSGWRVHDYYEGWRDSEHGGRKAVASIIAQLPGNAAKC